MLLKSIQNHEVCTFDTVTSRYVFGVPSELAVDFYKMPFISKQNDLCENYKDNEIKYRDTVDDDDEEEPVIVEDAFNDDNDEFDDDCFDDDF